MLRYLFIFFIPIIGYSQQDVIKEFYPFITIDRPPIFTNCLNIIDKEQKKCFEDELNKHIQENLQYPEEAFDSGLGGRVLLSFSIDKEGKILNILTKGPNEILENEVKRVISLIPKLEPAKINGMNVGINYALPVNFYLLTQFNINEITIKSGANIYESPDVKSKRNSYIPTISTLNATKKGDFWLAQLNTEGTYLGYIKNDDVLNVNNVENINIDISEIEPLKQSETNILELNIKKNEDINSNQSEELVDTEKLDNKSELSPIELIRAELDDDLARLESYTKKLNNQKEINRKIPGYNKADLYYTNALKQFLKILNRDIEKKYNILSVENPDAFEGTKFEVRNMKFSKKRAQRLKEQEYNISAEFLKINFYDFPPVIASSLHSDEKRLQELINEIKKLEYVIVEKYEIAETNTVDQNVNPKPERNDLDIETIEESINIDEVNTSESNIKQEPQLNNLTNNKLDIDNESDTDESKSKVEETSIDPKINVEEAKQKLKQLMLLYNEDLISKELYEESSNEFKAIIESDLKINVEEAKQKLKQLTLLFIEGLISEELYQESSNKFKVIVELDEVNKLKSIKIPDISDTEALNRIRNLKSLYNQGLINKETFEEATEMLKKIIFNRRVN